jgi:hypothetical protein
MNDELKTLYEILLDENSTCTSCELRLRMLEELEKFGVEE